METSRELLLTCLILSTYPSLVICSRQWMTWVSVPFTYKGMRLPCHPGGPVVKFWLVDRTLYYELPGTRLFLCNPIPALMTSWLGRPHKVTGPKHIKGSKERLFIRTQTDTQSANFRGNPLCQTTKRHLNNSSRNFLRESSLFMNAKWKKMKGWLAKSFS